MSKNEIRKILNCPFMDLLNLALELVNLKDKELIAIQLVDIKGKTEFEASEIMNCSLNSIKNYRKRAYKKLSKVWDKSDLAKYLLEL